MKFKSETKITSLILLLFLIILSYLLITLNKFEYPLAGDGEDHWRLGEAIKDDQSLLSYNVLFPEAPQAYPQGYHTFFVVFSNITGILLQKIFLLLPVILYLFYYCTVYLFVKCITKNDVIASLSGFSIFLYWFHNNRYFYDISFFAFAMPETLNIFLSMVVISLLLRNRPSFFYIPSILIFIVPFIHWSTSIGLFIFIGFMILFDLIKKDKHEVIKKTFLLFLLITGWSIQFIPIFINYGLPVSEISAHISPNVEHNSEGFIKTVSAKLDGEWKFFTERYFNLEIDYPIIYLWILSVVLGLIFLFKEKTINYKLFPYFLLPATHVINKLTLDINILHNPTYFFFTPIAYLLFSGIGLYYLFFRLKNYRSLILAVLFILILIPSSFSIIYKMPIKPENAPLALQSKEHLEISDDAIDFLKDTHENSTIIACPVTSKTLAITTKRNLLHTYRAHYGMYVFQLYDISQRHEDIKKIYESCDINETKELINKYGDNIYIYVGRYDKAMYKICFEKFETYFIKKDFRKDIIYYLNDAI